MSYIDRVGPWADHIAEVETPEVIKTLNAFRPGQVNGIAEEGLTGGGSSTCPRGTWADGVRASMAHCHTRGSDGNCRRAARWPLHCGIANLIPPQGLSLHSLLKPFLCVWLPKNPHPVAAHLAHPGQPSRPHKAQHTCLPRT
jgi:hypothetical protein